MLGLKSSMCRKISNAAKSILSVEIAGKDLFEPIGSLSAPAPPPPRKPFTFTSTKVSPVSKAITKPSTILKSILPPNKPTKAAPKQPSTSNHHKPSWCIFNHDRYPLITSWVQTFCFGIAKVLDQNVRN